MNLLANRATIGTALAPGRNAFGLTRLLLAAAVVWSHSYSVMVGSVEVEPLKQSTGYTLGEHAVNGFFVISGLLVAMSFDRRGLREYVTARLLRIAPGLVGATLFSALLLGVLCTTLLPADYFRHSQTWRFIWQVLTDLKSANRLPGVFEQNPFPFVMATIWTLKYEVFCYAGLALLASFGLLRNRTAALAFLGCVAVALIGYHLYNQGPHDRGHTALRLVFLFAFGSTAYVFRDRFVASWLLVAVFAALAWALRSTPLFTPAMLLAEAYGALTFALGATATRLPEPKDDLSYGIYLYGWPLQQGLFAFLPTITLPMFIAASFAVTVPLAYLSWRFVEAPLLRMKKRRATG